MVHEIAMATPGVISVEVRDPPVQYGQIIETGAPTTDGATKVTKVVNNGTGLCRVTTAAPIFSDVNTGAGGVTGFHSIVGVPGANGTFLVNLHT
jgi:hypothetical protein